MAMKKLKEFRKAAGLTLDQMSEKIGLSISQISRIERGERDMKFPELVKAAQVLGVSVSDLADDAAVPVVGYVGAGGDAVFEAITGEHETVGAPPSAPSETVAVKIRGESLGAGFDGWYALYADRRDPFTPDLLGRLCVVGTSDGRTLIKWVHRGPGHGFNLRSGTGHIEEDVEIEWGAEVIDLKPR